MNRTAGAAPLWNVVAAVSSVLLAAACGGQRQQATASPPPAARPAAAVPTGSAMPHGDHNPHHGGVVLMKGDLHYEAVFDPTGKAHQLYFSDAVREDLPASFASSVSFTIKRPGEADEVVPMQIDAAGESWIGTSRPIAHPTATTVRVAFTVAEESYWLDVPVTAEPAKP